MAASQKLKRVAVVTETAVAPRRRLLAGIARYLREHEPWAIYLKPHSVQKSLGRWLKNWNGDGIIAAAWGDEVAEVTKTGIPIVDVTGNLTHLGIPVVHTDDRAVGRLGAEHLLERNFQHYGFVEYDARWSAARREGFEAAVRARGFSCDVYRLKYPYQTEGGPEEWEEQQRGIESWIRALPKPVGVMTSTDTLGQQFLESCQRAEVVVPEEVAVVGADNDELICNICYPPLSSVNIDDEKRGYQTAAMLGRLMAGEKLKGKAIYIEPAGVTCRASTDILAIDDTDLARAVRFIRERGCESIGVDDLLKLVPVSRRALERRFKSVLGRTINDEIVRVRLNRAVELLTATDLGLKEIAIKAGFRSRSYMGAVFRERLARTPGSYRVGKA